MTQPIIQVENFGKRYRLSHRTRGVGEYRSLGESVTRLGRNFIHKLRHPFTGANETVEDFWALKDVNFEITAGDRVGIIGRNGAGKSTLLKLLCRITEPTTGKAVLRGRVASLLEVGTGFHPELSGRENIYLNGSILGMKHAEIKRKFDEIVDFSGVEKFLDTPVKRYSSGMYVRLAFAVAAHLEPEILLIDEVLAVGDAEFQKKCLGKMEDISRNSGRTILFVSHNMSALQKLCNRGILLQNGRLVMTDSCQNAISQYLSARDQNEIIEKKPRQLNAFAFTKIYTADNTGIAKSEFAWSDPMSLRVELYCPEHPRQEELAISLYDARKNRIFSIHHPLAAEVNHSGNVITMQLDLPREILAPGQYSWLICINHRRINVTDLQNDVCAFTVSETGSPYSDYAIGSCGTVCLECNVQKIKEEAYPEKIQ